MTAIIVGGGVAQAGKILFEPLKKHLDERLSPYFAERFAGQPFKLVALSFDDGQAPVFSRQGEFVATTTGAVNAMYDSLPPWGALSRWRR